MILSVRKTYGFFILLSFFLSLQTAAAPLCSVIFSHDFFVDEFADVRHRGALDIWLEPHTRWLRSPKQIPSIKSSSDFMPSRLNLREIHFMQNNISNNYADGKFTVVGNARDIRDGKLNPDTLPPVGVWRDFTGKIWTMDHRRLAALILSGKVETANVRWADPSEVRRQQYKMSTLSEGNFLVLTAKGRQSIVIEKPGMGDLKISKISSRNVPRFVRALAPKELKQTAWVETTQKPSSLLPKDIHFSATMGVDNSSLKMSYKLKNGQQSLPVLRVWTDSSGRVWTLDNDLLAALRLAGHQAPIDLHYLSREEHHALNAKVDSQTGGRSYVIPLKEENAALVVHQ